MYDLFILTTTIGIPDLHNKTLKPFFEDLNKQGLIYLIMTKILSFCNKDCIDIALNWMAYLNNLNISNIKNLYESYLFNI